MHIIGLVADVVVAVLLILLLPEIFHLVRKEEDENEEHSILKQNITVLY